VLASQDYLQRLEDIQAELPDKQKATSPVSQRLFDVLMSIMIALVRLPSLRMTNKARDTPHPFLTRIDLVLEPLSVDLAFCLRLFAAHRAMEG
jgi:hypothetical protein